MRILSKNISHNLLFPFLSLKRTGVSKMLCIKVKKLVLSTLVMFAFSSILFATNSYALFEGLTSTGGEIFHGMRDIIYAVSGFGVVGIAIAGFFGNLNWKWLSAIIIGLMVIAMTAGILNYMVGSDDGTGVTAITDTLISASGQ